MGSSGERLFLPAIGKESHIGLNLGDECHPGAIIFEVAGADAFNWVIERAIAEYAWRTHKHPTLLAVRTDDSLPYRIYTGHVATSLSECGEIADVQAVKFMGNSIGEIGSVKFVIPPGEIMDVVVIPYELGFRACFESDKKFCELQIAGVPRDHW